MRKIVPFVAATALVALILAGPGRGLLPSTTLLGRSGAPQEQQAADEHGHATTTSGIGLAPAPVVNPAATAARVSLSVQPAQKVERGYVLEATVRGADGKALADSPVKFYELVELFGKREMLIASAVTDGRGVASITYLPAQQGAHDLVVRTAQVGKVTPGEGRLTFDATVSAPQTRVQRSPLANFSDRVPYAAGALVLAVWGLIAFALIATARGVIGGARGNLRKGEPA